MGSKGHFSISIAKSMIRMCGCVLAVARKNPMTCVLFLGFAEILGIAEELVDER